MLNCKECRHKFNQITMRKENEGYTDWRKGVIEQIADYDGEKKFNLIKRYEIRLKKLKADEGSSLFQMVTQYVAVFAVLIPLLCTIFLTSFDMVVNAYSPAISEEHLVEYATYVGDMTVKYSIEIINVGVMCAAVSIIILGGAKCLDIIFKRRDRSIIVYYEELLEVLKEDN